MTTMFVDIITMLHLLAAVFKQSLPFRFMKPLRSVVGDWSQLFTVNDLYLENKAQSLASKLVLYCLEVNSIRFLNYISIKLNEVTLFLEVMY